MIQKMIFHLMDEQKNEDEHKHWCDKEITNTELMIKEKTEKSADSDSTITQLAEKIQDLKNGIEANQKFIAETEDEISSRTEDRAADKKENQATIDDAEDAQTPIAQAIAVLKTFYKESGEVAKEALESFVQLKVEPEPELWKEEEYTGTEGGAAVIGMLENCATDFAAMESQARADETQHQDDFDKFLTQAQMDKAARTKDTEMKEARKGRFEDKAARTKDTFDHTTKELEGTQQYRKDLEHACEDGDSSYGARKDARASEITALREAQGILDKAFEETDEKTLG